MAWEFKNKLPSGERLVIVQVPLVIGVYSSSNKNSPILQLDSAAQICGDPAEALVIKGDTRAAAVITVDAKIAFFTIAIWTVAVISLRHLLWSLFGIRGLSQPLPEKVREASFRQTEPKAPPR